MNIINRITKSAAWIGTVAIAAGLGYWWGRLDEDREQRELDEEDVDGPPVCAPGRAAPVIDIQATAPPDPPGGGFHPGSGAAGAVVQETATLGGPAHDDLRKLVSCEGIHLNELEKENRARRSR